jgi:hypothetical protein
MQCFVFRIEFLIIPAVALALLINHEFTVLEVRSKCTCACDREILSRDKRMEDTHWSLTW